MVSYSRFSIDVDIITEYLGVVYDSLATTGSQCNPAISNATATIEDMIKTTDGRKQLMDMFR